MHGRDRIDVDDGSAMHLQGLGPPGSEEALMDLGEKVIASRELDPALRQPKPWIDR